MNITLQFNSILKPLIRVVILLCISTSNLFAQNNKIDSLKQDLVSDSELESPKFNFELAIEYAQFDNKMALKLAMKSNSLAALKQDSLYLVKSTRLLGQLYGRLDNLDSSVYYFLKALPLAFSHKFDKERNRIMNGLGAAYIYLSKYDQALHYLLQSETFYEQIGDTSMISVLNNNLGLVYYKLKDPKMALKHFNKSLSLKKLTKDELDLDVLLINISLCHTFLGNLQEARHLLQPVLEKCLTNCDKTVYFIALHASGMIWDKSDSLSLAEKDFLQSYTAAKKNNNQRFIFDNINSLSKIYLKKGKLNLAEKFLLEGEKMLKKSRFDREEMRVYEQLSALYKVKRNYNKLSFYQDKYIQMKDSIYTQDQVINLMLLHAESAEKENKTQLASQEQTLHLKEGIINNQLGINILIGIAVALLIVLIYVLIKIFYQRKEANYLLNKKILERSDELLQNQQSLKLAIEQRNHALAKLSENLNNSIKSMQSLCIAGTKMEGDSNALRYFNEINSTTSNLSISLQRILPESNTTRLTGS